MEDCAALSWIADRREIHRRVAHLPKMTRIDVERIVRILRARFVDKRDRPPRRGELLSVWFVADRSLIGLTPARLPSQPTYEIWAVVNEPEYRGLETHWGEARRLLKSELGYRCTINLSVFDDEDFDRAISENGLIRSKSESAIRLFEIPGTEAA